MAPTALVTAGLMAASLSVPIAQASAAGTPRAVAQTAGPGSGITDTGSEVLGKGSTGLADLDNRGTIAPTTAQRQAVPRGSTVRWNRYGTPSSLINQTGYLSTAQRGSAVTIARTWLTTHRGVLGLTSAQVQNLKLLSDSRLTQSAAHAVRFRQQYGAATPAVDGMVNVAVTPDGRVAYVSSSLSRITAAAPSATLQPLAAWTKAVEELRSNHAPSIATPAVGGVTTRQVRGWTTFKIPGFAQTQQVRLRALARPGAGSRPVYEVNVVNSAGGAAAAYTSYVDAISGRVLIRHNRVDNLSTAPTAPMTTTSQPFQGKFTATACGPDHNYTVDAATKTINVSASAVAADEDIVLKLYYNHGGAPVATSDTATSPEAIVYSPSGGVPAGIYTVKVCPFGPGSTAPTVLGEYGGFFVASEQAAPTGSAPYPPEWKYFLSNPTLDFSPTTTTDNRQVVCWVGASGCTSPPTPLQNLAARGPWDFSFRANAPTNTTSGNAADTAEAWFSPLTPGGAQRPVSPNRHYGFGAENPGQNFTDAWNNSKCNPATAFTPANNNNDILASVTNLFAGHNRFHDFSYFLGFTETNYNLQDVNFGNRAQGGTVPSGGENDPEIGNVQAGALSGGQPSFLGRDNANQITLQDGTPGITNQYLFQPIAGAFYSPCADGDFDAPVYGHEYTHAISNRMVAGPDDGLSGYQAGSMGESWSDQVALEYAFEHSYSLGTTNPWVEGPYVTGNKVTGIRNYALNNNPLQYGDLGYDVTGPEVHADGEVWSAAMFDVRRALVSKYNGSYPESNKALQLRCADANTPRAPLPAEQCPGGRRWIQLMFDSFLLQESSTNMLDARDAFLAADKIRFGGANAVAIWNGFASRGMGEKASTTSTDDNQPKPDYTSPVASEGTLSLKALDLSSASQTPVKGKFYVGKYEARATPIADSDPSTALPSTIKMVPGTYDFVFQAAGYGLRRFKVTIKAGSTTARTVHPTKNLASSTNGAFIDGASAGSVNTSKLIDDTEATNWAGINPSGVSVDSVHPFVNVNLAGGRQVIRSVEVSAMLRPAGSDTSDPDSGSRFTALRKFAIETCTESATSDCTSSAIGAGSPYKRIYTSPDDAFNGVAPRPLAPDLLAKRFDIPDTTATHVRLVVLENQCTGQALYAGQQVNDPTYNTDCKSGSTRDESVRAAELQVFGYDDATRPPGDPVVAMTMTGPALAAAGDRVTYQLTYRNFGPAPSSAADIRITKLPVGLRFVSASNGAVYDAASRALLWRLGTVPVGATRSVTLTAKIAPTAAPGDVILTTAQFAGAKTYSPPAAAVTVVRP
ncbi:MAG: M36 family metallopeptidase [Actinomycetota bacterium]|nr:M36 family metallopeptidase [Actinomycetota bacterium]